MTINVFNTFKLGGGELYMYELLTNMFDGQQWTKHNIIRISSEEIFFEAVKKNYIEEKGKNNYNEPLYVITEEGKEEYTK